MTKTTKPAKTNRHLGSALDDVLAERGMLEEVKIAAVKRVITLEIADEMRRRHTTKSEMAKRMHTSRAMLDRVLDPVKESTLSSIAMAARAVGKRLELSLV
jgi:DNA-binding TFAR19-related protein (PDSD5 family)